ncbi:MAG: amino acid permease [Alphaproteobacteria bacterium]|nr:amino acid permease [Alphaproteobacteria bacterium]
MSAQSELAKVSADSVNHDDQAIIDAGYKPQLRRSLGRFASFAIPFSEISITTGIFANYGFVLGHAGPFGFWAWLLVAAGQMLLALVFAELAGRIPLTGSCYNWNNKLGNPTAAWFVGWLGIVGYTIGVAAVSTTMVSILAVIVGHPIDTQTGCVIASALIVVQMLINLYGVRLTSHINIGAVIAEIVGVGGLALLIVLAVSSRGHFNVGLLTTVPSDPHPYWQGFMMATLLGMWTMIGFECSADVSEETVNARRVTPKGILSALLVSAVVGFAFIVVMTLAIPDLSEISKASYPLAAIADYYLGHDFTNVFLIFALVAMFACSLVCMMAGSRIMFAVARDKRFIASSFFSKVSAHHVPKGPLFLMSAVAVVFTFMADSATSLYGAGTVCYVIYSLITVISFALKAQKMPKTDTFSLERWHWPVVILAALWLIVEIGVLTIPQEFHPVAIATGGVLAVGGAVYLIVMRKTGNA